MLQLRCILDVVVSRRHLGGGHLRNAQVGRRITFLICIFPHLNASLQNPDDAHFDHLGNLPFLHFFRCNNDADVVFRHLGALQAMGVFDIFKQVSVYDLSYTFILPSFNDPNSHIFDLTTCYCL